MQTEPHIVLQLIARLLAVLSVIQGVEFLRLSSVTGSQGVWRWADIESEFTNASVVTKQILRFLLKDRHFFYLNLFRIFIATAVLVSPQPVLLTILLLIHLATLLRWLGNFNGGSDYLTSILLLFTSLGLYFSDSKMPVISLWYITFQVLFSYFKAGWLKLKTRNWQNGLAIREFLNSPAYEKIQIFDRLTKSSTINTFNSWVVIAFEVLFPLSLVNKDLALIFMMAGLLFHLINAYVFGLNRFIFTWLAGYPAIYWCSLR